MRITEEERKKRRDRMLHVAYDLFCENGIDAVTMASIAERSGVSPNSVFRYFDSKLVLLQQTQHILWDEIVECITSGNWSARQSAVNGLQETQILLYGFQNLYENYAQYILFAYEYKAFLIRKKVVLQENEMFQMIHQIRLIFEHSLRKGQEDGSVRNDQTASELFIYIWLVMRGYVEQLVVHSQINTGDNPWKTRFASFVSKMLADLGNVDRTF